MTNTSMTLVYPYKARLARRRSSLSGSRFSEEDFQNFKKNNTMAAKDADTIAKVLLIIKAICCQERILKISGRWIVNLRL